MKTIGSVSIYSLLLSSSCFAWDDLPYFDQSSFSPIFAPTEFKASKFVSFQTFEAIDHKNKKFDVSQLQQKITVVNFFFTSCGGICPVIMNKIAEAKENIEKSQASKNKPKDPVQFLSISVSPEVDSPSAMNEFAKARGLNLQNWLLITGKRSETEKLARLTFRTGIGNPMVTSTSKKAEAPFVHSESVFLLDKSKFLRGVYNGKNLVELQLLKEDIETLQTAHHK